MNKFLAAPGISLLLRVFAFLLMLVSGLILLAAVDFDLSRLLDYIRATHPASFVLYMSLLPLMGFPIAAFYLYAGSAFPWWQAWLCCSLALAVNLALAYPVAKHLLNAPLTLLLQKYEKSLPAITKENQFRLTFIVRSVPGIPFFVQNYLLPLVGVGFVQYWVISWLIQTVISAGMTAIPHLVERGSWIMIGVLLGIFILLGVLHRIYVPRIRKNKGDHPVKPMA